MAAVQNNGKALIYASPELQADREVVMAAVKNDGTAIYSASPELQQDEEIKAMAIKQKESQINQIKEEIQQLAQDKGATEREEALRRVKDKIELVQQLNKELEALRSGERSVGQEYDDSIGK